MSESNYEPMRCQNPEDSHNDLFTPPIKRHGQSAPPYIGKINHLPRTRQQMPAKHKTDIDYLVRKKCVTTPKYT
jgi:hypothetical protein